jgi:arylsulfatase A-like enzyme
MSTNLAHSLSSLRSLAARLFLHSGERRFRLVYSLAVALLLAWVFMLVELSEVLHRVLALGRSSRVGSAVLREALSSSILKQEIAAYIGAHLFLHALFGLVLFGLGVATVRAFPRSRIRFFWIVSMWWVALVAWLYVANAALFHDSLAGPALDFVRAEIGWRLNLYHILTVVLVLAVCFVLIKAATLSSKRRQIGRVAIYGSIAALAVLIWQAMPELKAEEDGGAPGHEKPHVIVIGIDSLRSDMVGASQNAWFTPSINAFLRDSHYFEDAITPLARTFPSWITILSGRHPVSTNARDNLVPLSDLDLGKPLSARFRENGYRTIYATDEVRFSNIDRRYGFDRVIGPRMGASDFMLGAFNDLPLSNLIANSALAKWLFPNTFANRAAEVTYRPSTFTRWLEDELSFEAPTFLAVHLTLPHNPYTWAHESTDAFAGSVDNPYPYLAAVAAVDKQFTSLMSTLRKRGALRNAVVVVLSDHGEGLGLPADNLLASREAKAAADGTMVWMWGHGTSVLSPRQYSVVLGVRRFAGDTFIRPGTHDAPASLEDVAPTVLELARIEFEPTDFEGISLAPIIEGREQPDGALNDRVRFTETGISTGLLKQGKTLDKQAMVAEGGFYFAVDHATGRVRLRTEQWNEFLKAKERAAFTKDWLLAAIPVDGAASHKYLFVNRRGGVPKLFREPPSAEAEPVAAHLWHALQERYADEQGEPQREAAVTQ